MSITGCPFRKQTEVNCGKEFKYSFTVNNRLKIEMRNSIISTLPSVPRYSMDLFCFLWFGRHGNPLRPANRKQARKPAESAAIIWNFSELQQ
ncbi:hypothetical protein SRHO_G00333060 [Serrasalmus rhombeus]